MSLVWELERSPTEVFSFQKPVKFVMQFYKESYAITKIITQVREKVPNTNCSTKPGGCSHTYQHPGDNSQIRCGLAAPDRVSGSSSSAGCQRQQRTISSFSPQRQGCPGELRGQNIFCCRLPPWPTGTGSGVRVAGWSCCTSVCQAPHPASPQQGTAAVPALTQRSPGLTRIWSPMLTRRLHHHGTVHVEQKEGEFYQQHKSSAGLIPSHILLRWEENPAPQKRALTREDKWLLTVKNLSCNPWWNAQAKPQITGRATP